MGKVVAASGDEWMWKAELQVEMERVRRAPRQRRVIPTSVAPITFFVREEADWMAIREIPHPGRAKTRQEMSITLEC